MSPGGVNVPEISPPPPTLPINQDQVVDDGKGKEEGSAEAILRRVSNAYLASGGMPNLLVRLAF